MDHLDDEEKKAVSNLFFAKRQFAVLVGAGISCALTNGFADGHPSKALQWMPLLNRLRDENANVNGLNDEWRGHYDAGDDAEKAMLLRSLLVHHDPDVKPPPYNDYRFLIYKIFRDLELNPANGSELIPQSIKELLRRSLRGDVGTDCGTVLSVNYDTLIDDALDRAPISHIDVIAEGYQPASIDKLGIYPGTRNTLASRHVIHLHGLYTERSDINGFTLHPDEYANEGATARFVDFMASFVAGFNIDDGIPETTNPHRLVFIGCNGTLQDAHFTALFERLSQVQVPESDRILLGIEWYKELEHIVLVSGDAGAVEYTQTWLNNIPNATLRAVSYGANHQNLGPFLNALSTLN